MARALASAGRGWRRIAPLVVASVLAAGGGVAAQGPSASVGSPVTSASPGSAGAPIPIRSIADLSSLQATVTIHADGTLDGKPTTGDLTLQFSTNDQGTSQTIATGSLLGTIVAKVGGNKTKLMRPSSVGIYATPNGAYVVVSGFVELCLGPVSATTTATLDQLSPTGLMHILAGADVARGTYVGDDTRDGIAVQRYSIDGPAFLAAARASTDPTVQAFGQALTSAGDAELDLFTDSGYPASYRGSFTGALPQLGIDGSFDVAVDVTAIDQPVDITLPGSCDHAVPV